MNLIDENKKWYKKFARTKAAKYLKLFLILIQDSIDVVIDWFFYWTLTAVSPGLVYGPVDSLLKWTTLAFCLLSTLFFVLEVIQHADDIFEKKKLPCLTQHLSNFLIIFIENVPILVINLIVTLCNDGVPSTVTLAKASFVIFGVVFKILIMLLNYWVFDSKKTRFDYFLDAMSSFGLFIMLTISIAIQLLNVFPVDSSGMISISIVKEFDRMEFATNKYLKNVGVFTKWPIDSQINAQNHTDFSYLWLCDVTEVIKKPYLALKIRTDFNSIKKQNYTICIKKSQTESCFLIQDTLNAKEIASTSVNSLNYEYNFIITKEPAQQYKYPIGFIDYNLKLNDLTLKNSNESCKDLPTTTTMLYAKYNGVFISSNTSHAFMKQYNGRLSFYDYLNDLISVDKFWRVGYSGCKMTGDLGPKRNKDMRLFC